MAALVPRVKEYEEVIGGDTQYHKYRKIVKDIEVSHADDVLANEASGTERKADYQHRDKSQEEGLQVNDEPNHYEGHGDKQVVGVILGEAFELLVADFTGVELRLDYGIRIVVVHFLGYFVNF